MSDEELADAESVVQGAAASGRVKDSSLLATFFEVATLIFLAEWGDRCVCQLGYSLPTQVFFVWEDEAGEGGAAERLRWKAAAAGQGLRGAGGRKAGGWGWLPT